MYYDMCASQATNKIDYIVEPTKTVDEYYNNYTRSLSENKLNISDPVYC